MQSTADWLVLLLEGAAIYRDPSPGRGGISGLDHALQSATRAERDNASDELILVALLHDAARPLSDVHHGRVMSEILRGRLSDEAVEIVAHHSEFQALGPVTLTARYGEASWFEAATRFASWDSVSFSPTYKSRKLDSFLPLLQETFGQCQLT